MVLAASNRLAQNCFLKSWLRFFKLLLPDILIFKIDFRKHFKIYKLNLILIEKNVTINFGGFKCQHFFESKTIFNLSISVVHETRKY